MTSHRRAWSGLVVVGACVLAACAPAADHGGCSLADAFVRLQSALPDRVGVCTGPVDEQPELGQLTQPTTQGQLLFQSVDGVASFSDGMQTWLLDAAGQVQVREADERFAWEFNGDGWPLVGQPLPTINGPCPTEPVRVLAVENFYANLASQIGGQCVQTTAILADPDADPHEFQPAASDVRQYQNAQLVIENGLGYDDFSDRVLSTLSNQPALVNVGDVLGRQIGDNPHVWYGAGNVDRIRAAVLSNLKTLNPQASAYYDAQSAAVDQAFAPYYNLINQVSSAYGNTPVGSTESVFLDMADSTHLDVISPPAFMRAVAEGNEPSARDIASFQTQITNHRIKVLVYNTQTVTAATDELKALAEENDIPIVGVSETMPSGAETLQGWHATELELLRRALQKGTTSL